MTQRPLSAIRTSFFLLIALASLPADAVAQSFDLSWYTVDGGGATFTTGGSFEMSGTIGQHDAGAMTGGSFELVGGFWGAAAPGGPPCDACDADCDGAVNARDIEAFIGLLFPGDAPCGLGCAGDTNGDGNVNASDIEGFIDCLFSP